MHIGIITPAAAKSLNGNRATAKRWANIFIQLGHTVSINTQWAGEACDVMVALHAWRSAESITEFKKQDPNKPIILAMTGTDLYRFINTHPEPTLASIKTADKLVTLHDLAYRVLPKTAHNNIHVIHQSAKPLNRKIKRSVRTFDICVVGHLREEKDSLRVAYAVRDLPSESKIRVMHYGKAHNEEWANKAKQEMKTNARYHWLGEVPKWKVREAYGRCHLMVLPSVMEGGANVISEAVVAGLPVIASDIDGSVGLLGEDYAGYFSVKDEMSLRELLLKAENNKNYVRKLTEQCELLKNNFSEFSEKESWWRLLNKL